MHHRSGFHFPQPCFVSCEVDFDFSHQGAKSVARLSQEALRAAASVAPAWGAGIQLVGNGARALSHPFLFVGGAKSWYPYSNLATGGPR